MLSKFESDLHKSSTNLGFHRLSELSIFKFSSVWCCKCLKCLLKARTTTRTSPTRDVSSVTHFQLHQTSNIFHNYTCWIIPQHLHSPHLSPLHFHHFNFIFKSLIKPRDWNQLLTGTQGEGAFFNLVTFLPFLYRLPKPLFFCSFITSVFFLCPVFSFLCNRQLPWVLGCVLTHHNSAPAAPQAVNGTACGLLLSLSSNSPLWQGNNSLSCVHWFAPSLTSLAETTPTPPHLPSSPLQKLFKNSTLTELKMFYGNKRDRHKLSKRRITFLKIAFTCKSSIPTR